MTDDSSQRDEHGILGRIRRSPLVGAVVGGAIMVCTAAAALSLGGALDGTRATLPFYVVVPVAVATVGALVTATRLLDARQMVLSVLSVELLIIAWTGLSGETIVLGSALAVNSVVCAPWLAGWLVGTLLGAARRRGARTRA